MRVKLKGINKVKKKQADGTVKVHYYLRGVGKLKPVEGDEGLPFRPGTVAFQRAYNSLIAITPTESKPRAMYALVDLISAYRQSSRFNALSPRSQRDYMNAIGRILEKWASLPIAALEDKKIRPLFLEWRDRMAQASSRQADMTMTILGTILNWAMDEGRIGHNYAAKPGRTYTVDRSDKIWLPRHVEAFRKHATPEMELAMIMALHTGQRQGDLLELQWKHIQEGRLRYRQSKKKRLIDIPLTKALAGALEKERARGHNDSDDDHILLSSARRKWSADGFRGAWAKVVAKAGLDKLDLHFHDLRGTACTLLAEGGCDDTEIGAMLGWKREYVAQMRARYQATNALASDRAIRTLERGLKKRDDNVPAHARRAKS